MVRIKQRSLRRREMSKWTQYFQLKNLIKMILLKEKQQVMSLKLYKNIIFLTKQKL
jgi:hypothetical protein